MSGLVKDGGKSGGLKISIGWENFRDGSPRVTQPGRHVVTDGPAEVVRAGTSEVLQPGQGLCVPGAAVTWKEVMALRQQKGDAGAMLKPPRTMAGAEVQRKSARQVAKSPINT